MHDDGVYCADDWVLQPGHVLAIEPGLYFPRRVPPGAAAAVDRGAYRRVRRYLRAVRVEDTLTVTDDPLAPVRVLSGELSYSPFVR